MSLGWAAAAHHPVGAALLVGTLAVAALTRTERPHQEPRLLEHPGDAPPWAAALNADLDAASARYLAHMRRVDVDHSAAHQRVADLQLAIRACQAVAREQAAYPTASWHLRRLARERYFAAGGSTPVNIRS